MVRKLLGLIFNRFVLVGLLLLGLLAVIWWFGPLIAIGDSRPLDSDRSRWITSAALILAVVSIFAWSALRSRRGNAQVVAQLVAASAGAQGESADMASFIAAGPSRKPRIGGCSSCSSPALASGENFNGLLLICRMTVIPARNSCLVVARTAMSCNVPSMALRRMRPTSRRRCAMPPAGRADGVIPAPSQNAPHSAEPSSDPRAGGSGGIWRGGAD